MTIIEIAMSVSALCSLGALIISGINARKISNVHVSINSRMDQLLVERGIAERASGHKEGHKEGLQEGRDETR